MQGRRPCPRGVYNRTVIPPLQGQLSTYGFPDLLQWMEMNRRSGRLTVMRGKDRKVIDWKDGHIAYVSGSHPKDRLGVFLNRIGAVPTDVLHTLLATNFTSGTNLTRLLLDGRHDTLAGLSRRAEELARRLARDRHPYVVGFNLAGDEAGYPPAQFREAYEIAAVSGLGCTVHAGEHAGAESVREALTLPVSRLSHGVRAIEDPALVEEIAERGIVLEVCPTSNVATHVYASYEEHPLRKLHEAGVKCTLGSDDPPYFGCSIGGEYAAARERFGFEEGELRAFTRTAVRASFADDATKGTLLNRITASDDRGDQ